MTKLALVEVYEVASFYAHFDIVMDGEPAPPPLTIRVCDSLTCALFGADKLLAELPAQLGAEVRVVRAPCMGGCHNAPVTARSATRCTSTLTVGSAPWPRALEPYDASGPAGLSRP